MITLTKRISNWLHKISVMMHTPAPVPAHMSVHCTNINMLLMHLCDFDRAQYTYVLKWLAYPLRHPGAKMRYGLAVCGPQSTGISFFFNEIARALHQGDGCLVQPHALMNQFNSEWAGSPLVVVDGDIPPFALAHVKSLMTSEFVVVNRKNFPTRMETNRMNFIFLSGSVHAIPQYSDRRFCVIEAPPRRDRIFYDAVSEEIRNGGIDTFRDYLVSRLDMGGFNETTMPPVAGAVKSASERSEHRAAEGQAA